MSWAIMLLQVAAVHDPVDEAVLQQELAGLETLGQLHADRLLDDAGAGESDQGLGLGEDEIAQGREAGRDAAHGGMGEHADEQAAGPTVTPQGRRDLRHLHQGEDPFVHSGPAA